jgi:aminopeptidase YwaD
MADSYVKKASQYLNALCSVKPHRRTGSAGNRRATAYVARKLTAWGYAVDDTLFACLDFDSGAASLRVGRAEINLQASHFSLGCEVTAELVSATTVEELERCNCSGKILLLHGEICSEPLMPKNFVFYNPDHHKRIYALLESKQPAAIITATTRSPSLVGGEYPFAMIEDGDFDIPSAFCKETVGRRILKHLGKVVRLHSTCHRIPSTACNVIARKHPRSRKKIVVCAHIDARANTPGATDDATGIVIQLLLAEMLRSRTATTPDIEFVCFNGEDYYSVGGQMDYLRRYGAKLDRIVVAINLDDIGWKRGLTAFSLYQNQESIDTAAHTVFSQFPGIIEGEQWYQGDHMIFVQKSVPAIALTAEKMPELMATITHTPKDRPEIVDCAKLVETAYALSAVVEALSV